MVLAARKACPNIDIDLALLINKQVDSVLDVAHLQELYSAIA